MTTYEINITMESGLTASAIESVVQDSFPNASVKVQASMESEPSDD